MENCVTKPSLGLEGDYQDDKHLITSGNEEEDWHVDDIAAPDPRQCYISVLWTIFLLCLAVNILQAWWLTHSATRFYLLPHHASPKTIWDNSSDFILRSVYPKEQYEYTDLGAQVADDMFKVFDSDKGVVALPKEGLPNVPPSKAFPWDATKEVYILSGYYSLYSLKVLWSELYELSGDEPLAAHVLHSLMVIWEDIMCAARTEPITLSTDQTLVDTVYQTRQCRDWSELEQFWLENSACFKKVEEARKQEDMFAEWQFCPEGSPYQLAVDQHLASKQPS